MLRMLSCWLLFLCIASACKEVPSAPAHPQRKRAPKHAVAYQLARGNVYGLFIGVQDYTKLPRLRYAASDACKVFNAFHKYGQLKAENAFVLLDKGRTCENAQHVYSADRTTLFGKSDKGGLLNRVKGLAVQPTDRIILYFAGHGVRQASTLHLAFSGLQKDHRNTKKAGFSIQELKHTFHSETMLNPQLFLLLDTCHAGLSFKPIDTQRYLQPFMANGRLLFASSRNGEKAVEWFQKKSGLFTHYLVEGLEGKADKNLDGYIDHLELISYTTQQVTYMAPQIKKEQHIAKRYHFFQQPVHFVSATGMLYLTRYENALKRK